MNPTLDDHAMKQFSVTMMSTSAEKDSRQDEARGDKDNPEHPASPESEKAPPEKTKRPPVSSIGNEKN
jgi:hypothetical protein